MYIDDCVLALGIQLPDGHWQCADGGTTVAFCQGLLY